jgi:hypothetical protein
MVTIRPNEEQKQEARKLANQLGELKNSFMKGTRNYEGMLGEIVGLSYVGASNNSCKDYDGVLKNGKTVDVKTKRTKVEPKSYYDCSISEFSLHQKCDLYLFTRYNYVSDEVYLLGYLNKDDFFKQARKYAKGDVDPSNNMEFKSTTYNVRISNLKPIGDLL